MDLGVRGKRAIVCASSKGLGLGCAEALAEAFQVDLREGADLYALLQPHFVKCAPLLEIDFGRTLEHAAGMAPELVDRLETACEDVNACFSDIIDARARTMASALLARGHTLGSAATSSESESESSGEEAFTDSDEASDDDGD